MVHKIYEIVYIFLSAILISLFCFYIIGKKGPWKNIYLFFIIIFLGTWSIYSLSLLEIQEHGARFFLSVLAFELILAFLLMASSAREKPQNKVRDIKNYSQLEVNVTENTRINRKSGFIYFWMLLIFFTLLILMINVFSHL